MTAPKNIKRKQSPTTEVPRSSEMREHVLDCALTIFAEKGYAATSVRDIIHVAEATQPTLYYYFDGKLGLFLELLTVKYEASLRELQSSISQVQGCREQLHSIMLQSFTYCVADVRVPRLMFQTAFGPAISGVTEQLERLGSLRFDLVKTVIARGIAAGELAPSSVDGLTLAFCCLMDQHINVLSRLDDSPTKLTPQLADWLVELFFQGATTI